MTSMVISDSVTPTSVPCSGSLAHFASMSAAVSARPSEELGAAESGAGQVHHPSRPNHPNADVAARLLPRGSGGMLSIELSFELAGGRAAVDTVIDRLGNTIPPSPSLADVVTTLVRPATTTHRSLPSSELEALGITDGLVRLSVGIEDPADLVAELAEALRHAPTEDRHDDASGDQ